MEVKRSEITEIQLQFEGTWGCNFMCLTECPLPLEQDCIYDDPGIGMLDLIEYPEFFWWQENHKKLVRREPKDPLRARCNRCLSVRVTHARLLITCKNCGYAEPLIDFPCSETFYSFFERKGFN